MASKDITQSFQNIIFLSLKNILRLIKQIYLDIRTRKILFCFLLILLFLSVFLPKRNLIWEYQEKRKTENKILKLQEILKQYPNSRDVYLRLAALNWKIYNNQKAKMYLRKAKELDPNFKTTKALEKIIQE